jgi:hypothetical protein
MSCVYVVTCFYNPAWGLRSPDNYDHFDKVLIAENKGVANQLSDEYKQEKRGKNPSVIIMRQPIIEML